MKFNEYLSDLNNEIRASINNKLIPIPINQTREKALNFIARLLKHESSKSFDISYNNLNNEEALIIINSLSGHITSINISNNLLNHNIAKNIYENLKDHKKLKEIDISDNIIGDEGITYMSKVIYSNNTITAMYMNNISISSVGIKTLSNAVCLKKLTLGGNKISNKGISIIANKLLKDNENLIKLDISNNLICNEGIKLLVEVLATNNVMKKLILYGNKITNEGAYDISNLLRINNVLEKLPLYGNNIGDVGAEAIFKALIHNKNIVNISLICNEIYDNNIILSINRLTNENMSRKYKSKIDSILWKDDNYNGDDEKNLQYVQVENMGDNYFCKVGENLFLE